VDNINLFSSNLRSTRPTRTGRNFIQAIENGVYGNRSALSTVNRALLQSAEKKLMQKHYGFGLFHNTPLFLDKNIFTLVQKGINSNQREGETIFLENITVRMAYTPYPDRKGQTMRFCAYLTTPGTGAVDTAPVDPATGTIANTLIQTFNEDEVKVITDRIITIDREQSGALKNGTLEYPGVGDWVNNLIPDSIVDLRTLAQTPTSFLTFKIPINRKLTYVNNTLLLGNNVLNIVVSSYEAYATRSTDKIGYIEASLTLNFKDAP
jgi:hypothetical protein